MNQLASLDTNIENIEPPRPLTWDAPRWMVEDYEGMEEEIAEDIYSAFYWRMRKEAEEKARQANESIDFDNDIAARARLVSKAVMDASIHADKINKGSERAFFRLVWAVQRNGFFRTSGEEFESISEWLADRIPRLSEQSGELSDIMYLMQHVFPLLERIQNGWRAPDLMKIQEHWSKTRAAVPYLRQLTRTLQDTHQTFADEIEKTEVSISKLKRKASVAKTPEEREEIQQEVVSLKEKVKKIEETKEKEVKKATKEFMDGFDRAFRVIQNPEVPTWGPTGVGAVLKAGSKNALKKFQGYKALLSDRQTLFTVIVPERYDGAVESMLRTLVDFQLTDGAIIVSDIGKAVLRKEE